MPRINPALPAPTGLVIRGTVVTLTDNNIQEYSCDFMGSAMSATGFADVQMCANTLLASIGLSWKPANSTSSQLLKVNAQCLNNTAVPSWDAFPTVITTGGVAGAVLPFTVAAVYTKVTGTKGQHGRGRMYPGPIPEAFVSSDPNLLDPTLSLPLLALCNNIIGTVFSGGTGGTVAYAAVVATRSKPGPGVSGAAPIIESRLNMLLGNIRRRRLGRGV